MTPIGVSNGTMRDRIDIVEADITTLDVDAIVNAANKTLLGGGGVDGAIHRAAGPELRATCAKLKGCETGEAKITPGFRLSAGYVIHTVGPIWGGGTWDEDRLLALCYANSLGLAVARSADHHRLPCHLDRRLWLSAYPRSPRCSRHRARRLAHRAVTEARRVLLLRQGVVWSPRNRACGGVERRQLVLAAPIIVWLRQDLRLGDHPALAAAANTSAPVLPLYILDDAMPGRWRMGAASRWWLHGSLTALNKDLEKRGGHLCLRQGKDPEVLAALLAETSASAIYATRGYEPWEPALEKAVAEACKIRRADFHLFGGRLLFEPEAVLTGDGKPYRVFSSFWKACLASKSPRAPLPAPKLSKFAEARGDRLDSWGLLPTQPDWAEGLRETWQPGEAVALARLGEFVDKHVASYADNRSRLDLDETSRLSPHLHFGEISPNQAW